MITNFQNKKMPKEKAPCKQVFINNNARFLYQSKKKYYPQALLEECKYEQENIKMENLINDDLKNSLCDESNNGSNDETEFDNDESNE